MADYTYNEAKRALMAKEIDLANDDIRLLLVMSNSTAGAQNDGITRLSDFADLDEFDGANYVRKQLANKTLVSDDANDRAVFDADDPTWESLGAGTRNGAGAVLYLHVTDDDDSIPIRFMDFSFVGDGNNFTVEFDVQGILQGA